jgi:RHS repeat-associated protein
MTAATYDGTGLRASATTASGTQSFVWEGPRLLMDSSNAYIYTGGTAPAEQVSLSGGTVSYLTADSLGSVRGIVSSSGPLTASTSYDAWGNPLTTGGLTSYTPFGYAGGYTDPTGLIYLINRYYDPGTGQFLSVDPAVSQTGQPYSYADGNPVNASDPNGLWRIGIPLGEPSFDQEWEFRNFYIGPLLGLGKTASREWKFEDGESDPGFRRVIDLYFSDNESFGWLNELKIGKQHATLQNESEILADRVMMTFPHDFCHPATNNWGRKPCTFQPINGDTWWFRYKEPDSCQISYGAMKANDWCPDSTLRGELLAKGARQINIVYVFYVAEDAAQDIIENIYAQKRTQIRTALERNSCPTRAIKATKLFPIVTYC